MWFLTLAAKCVIPLTYLIRLRQIQDGLGKISLSMVPLYDVDVNRIADQPE